MKKIFLFLLIALCFSVHSHAVLKEKKSGADHKRAAFGTEELP